MGGADSAGKEWAEPAGPSSQPVDDVGESSGGKKTASPSCFPKMRGCGGPRVEEDREAVTTLNGSRETKTVRTRSCSFRWECWS